MKTTLLFDFTVNMESRTVTVRREFDAEIKLVWEAWTNPKILDQWWAPEPYKARTVYMDFKEGGRRFYAMVGPDNSEESWNIEEYTSISPENNFRFLSVFADTDENMQLPGTNWDVSFSAKEGITMVNVSIYSESREELERWIKMGFREGFTMALNQLVNLLQKPKP